MRTLLSALAVSVLVFSGAAHSDAATTLTAVMTNGQETSPVVPTFSNGTPRPTSSGTATFTLNDAQTAMSFTATILNIDFTGTQTPDTFDNLTNAHIHASAVVTPTTNAPVVWGFIGSPFNDNNPTDVVVTPFAEGVGATVTGKWDAPEGQNTTLTAQLANILSEHAYVNFHTVQFGGGEIRGTLVVPEPSAASLLLVLSAAVLRRRRAAR